VVKLFDEKLLLRMLLFEEKLFDADDGVVEK
jgi:hypothetical protein